MEKSSHRGIVTEHSQITRNFAALTSRTVKLAYRMVPRVYPLATRVVAVSGGVADDLAKFSGMGRDDISVIHNGIVTPELYAKAAEPCDPFRAGPQHQMIGVAQHDIAAGCAHVLRQYGFHSGRGADRHEGGRANLTARR